MAGGSRLEVLAEYGYDIDPFRGVVLETADGMRIKRVLRMAVESRAMISVVASWGFGKSTALALALKDLNATVVRLITPDKERVVVSDIEKALILHLSTESCARTKEVRARQIRRILGAATDESDVVLVLEEAHRMHGQTLRALKTFREMEWKGRSPIFTVVMVGQTDPMNKRQVGEVRLRTDTIRMRGITAGEVKDYISATVGEHFESDAIEAVSRRPEGRNFLDLQEMLVELMARALEAGQRKVTPVEVFELCGGGIKEVLKRTGLKQSDIARETGLSPATVSLVVNEKTDGLSDGAFKEARGAITDVLRKHSGGDAAKPGLKVMGGAEVRNV